MTRRRLIAWIVAVLVGFWIAAVLATTTWVSAQSAAILGAVEKGTPLVSWDPTDSKDVIRGTGRFQPSSYKSEFATLVATGTGPHSVALNLRGRPVVVPLAQRLQIALGAGSTSSLSIVARADSGAPLLTAGPIPIHAGATSVTFDLADAQWRNTAGKPLKITVTQIAELRLLASGASPVHIRAIDLIPSPATAVDRRRASFADSLNPVGLLNRADRLASRGASAVLWPWGSEWWAGASRFWFALSAVMAGAAPLAWLWHIDRRAWVSAVWALGVLLFLAFEPNVVQPTWATGLAVFALTVAGIAIGWRRWSHPSLAFGSPEAWRDCGGLLVIAALITAIVWQAQGAPQWNASTPVWRYLAWAFIQQWLLARVLLVRRSDHAQAGACAGALFGLLHWPSLPLMAVTGAAGWFWARLHQRGSALVPATLSHGVGGWLLLSVLPDQAGISGEVGLRYFGY